MKKLFIIGPIVVVAALVLFLFLGKGKQAAGKYTTAEIQRGDISITVTATGTLQAVTTVQVGSQVSGTILALNVDFNSRVKKGEIIAQLDPTFLKAQVAQAEADLDKVKASMNLAKTEFDRAKSLFERNLIAASDRDNADAAYQQTQADLKSSQANLDRSRINLAYATITSPIDGVVISRNVDVGQTVAASLQAPTLFTIAQDLTKMQVIASIDEADIGKIQDDQNVLFTVDAYPDQKFDGTVQQVRLNPQIVQNVVSYDVIIAVSNPDMQLMPGMTANVTVEVQRQNDVLKVPSAALRFHPASGKTGTLAAQAGARSVGSQDSPQASGANAAIPDSTARLRHTGKTRIWILDAQSKPKPVPVQIGLSDGTSTAIISDSLKEGELVIVGQEGVQAATNNQTVNPFLPRFGGGGGGRGGR
jgi:HlyD family secretion protein